MKKLLFLLVIAAGAGWYWHTQGLPLGDTPGAFDAQGKPQVWVFTFKDCGEPCDDALADLRKRGQDFEEKQINPDERDNPDVRIWRRLGKNSFPLIMVGDTHLNNFSRPQLGAMLADHFGKDVLHLHEQRYFKDHFNADGSPRIVMYATDWCGYCRRLRQEFVDNQVVFTEVDVEKHSERQMLVQTLEIRGVPSTWVGYKQVKGNDLAAVRKTMKL